MRKMMQNKKGMFDVLIIVAVLIFVLGLVWMFSAKAFSDITEGIVVDGDLGETSEEMLVDLEGRTGSTLDAGLITVLVLMWIVLLAASWYSTDNPFLMVIVIVMMIFLLLTSIMLANSYEELFEDDTIMDIKNDFPMTNFVLTNNLGVTIAMIMGMIGAMVLRNRVYG